MAGPMVAGYKHVHARSLTKHADPGQLFASTNTGTRFTACSAFNTSRSSQVDGAASWNGPAMRRLPCITPVRKPWLQQFQPNSEARSVKAEALAVPAAGDPAPAAGWKWQGAKLFPASAAIAVGLALRFLVPIPDTISAQAWSLLSIFVSTVLGLVLTPLPVGAWATVAITATVASGTLSFQQAFSAMTNEVIWLIVASFFFAKGFEKTGLGERIANIFVKAFGQSTLGLSLGLNVAEAVVSPAMPSSSARAGGIFMPIINSLSVASGSKPGDDSRNKVGTFLTQSQLQTSCHSSNLFITASAQNYLCLKLAAEVGAPVSNAFVTWFQGAILPALAGLFLTPVLMYYLCPPLLKDTPEAPSQADKRLQDMGPMKWDEKIMSLVMILAVTLWIFGEAISMPAVVAALIGLSILLFTGVLEWKDCLGYAPAWDTLLWFAVLISMSGQLNAMGIISYFSDIMGCALTSLNLGWPLLFGAIHLVFFFIHYMFAGQTAHVGALFAAFCAIMVGAGVPPVLAAMTLAYNVNLNGAMTHYASGPAAVYYGGGYMRIGEVFKLGALAGLFHLATWGVVGMPWWKLLGWW